MAQGGGEVMLKVPILKLMPPINMLQEGEPTSMEHELTGPCVPLPAVPSHRLRSPATGVSGFAWPGFAWSKMLSISRKFSGRHVLP